MSTQGEGNRVVAEHQLNRESSRSHTIFSIMLERSTGAEGDEVIVSKLNLVDLAGSERISKTKSEGMVLKEAQQINKSLSFLEQVCFWGLLSISQSIEVEDNNKQQPSMRLVA